MLHRVALLARLSLARLPSRLARVDRWLGGPAPGNAVTVPWRIGSHAPLDLGQGEGGCRSSAGGAKIAAKMAVWKMRGVPCHRQKAGRGPESVLSTRHPQLKYPSGSAPPCR